MPSGDEFVLVRSKKRRQRTKKLHNSNLLSSDSDKDSDVTCEALLRKLAGAVTYLTNSPFHSKFFDALTNSLRLLDTKEVSEIVCYGLGQFSRHRSSVYQLALLLSLKAKYKCVVSVYDPIFCSVEIDVLKTLGLEIIENNEEGKRIINKKTTLMYMPHCSRQLTNNFLYANWGSGLSDCVLLSNSFRAIVEHSKKGDISNSAEYILRISPYVTEICLENNFEYEEVFNSFNIHVFTKQNLSKVPSEFWSQKKEPHYAQDKEFITVEGLRLE